MVYKYSEWSYAIFQEEGGKIVYRGKGSRILGPGISKGPLDLRQNDQLRKAIKSAGYRIRGSHLTEMT